MLQSQLSDLLEIHKKISINFYQQNETKVQSTPKVEPN